MAYISCFLAPLSEFAGSPTDLCMQMRCFRCGSSIFCKREGPSKNWFTLRSGVKAHLHEAKAFVYFSVFPCRKRLHPSLVSMGDANASVRCKQAFNTWLQKFWAAGPRNLHSPAWPPLPPPPDPHLGRRCLTLSLYANVLFGLCPAD